MSAWVTEPRVNTKAFCKLQEDHELVNGRETIFFPSLNIIEHVIIYNVLQPNATTSNNQFKKGPEMA